MVTSLLAVRQVVLTLFLPMAEHMLPIVQDEKWVIEDPVAGFMIKAPWASQDVELNGQHC